MGTLTLSPRYVHGQLKLSSRSNQAKVTVMALGTEMALNALETLEKS